MTGKELERRTVLASIAGVSVVGFAGCSGDGNGNGNGNGGGGGGDNGGDDGGGDLTGSVSYTNNGPDVEITSHSASIVEGPSEKQIEVTLTIQNNTSQEQRASGFTIDVKFYKSGATSPVEGVGANSIVDDTKIAAGDSATVSSKFGFGLTDTKATDIAEYELIV